MGNRTNEQSVKHGADSDRAAQKPARYQYRQFDGCSNETYRHSSATRNSERKPITWTRSQLRTDVGTGRNSVQCDRHEQHDEAQQKRPRFGKLADGDIDDQPDYKNVADRAHSGSLMQRNPKKKDTRADDDGPCTDRESE